MEKKNSVFIATSLDGYIADKNGGIDWLDSIPGLNTIDTGYNEFTSRIDALVMGRSTFETVCGFDIDWPYQKPVFVLSHSLTEIPEKLSDKVQLVKGTLKGYHRLYIDGGKVIQSFLKEDLIDDMIMFADLPNRLDFECKKSTIFIDKVVQNHFTRKKS